MENQFRVTGRPAFLTVSPCAVTLLAYRGLRVGLWTALMRRWSQSGTSKQRQAKPNQQTMNSLKNQITSPQILVAKDECHFAKSFDHL